MSRSELHSTTFVQLSLQSEASTGTVQKIVTRSPNMAVTRTTNGSSMNSLDGGGFAFMYNYFGIYEPDFVTQSFVLLYRSTRGQ